jgi:MerR HTH family regulatory protein
VTQIGSLSGSSSRPGPRARADAEQRRVLAGTVAQRLRARRAYARFMDVEAGLTIADGARASSLSAYTLRSYECAGPIDDVGRAGSGHRRYSDDDLMWIEELCLRPTGMPIRDIRRYADPARADDGNDKERLYG